MKNYNYFPNHVIKVYYFHYFSFFDWGKIQRSEIPLVGVHLMGFTKAKAEL